MGRISRPPPGASQLRLDDILDVLAGREGRAVVQDIKQGLRGAIDFEKPAVLPKPNAQVDNHFDYLTAKGLTGSFLRRSEGTAAIPNAAVFALAHAADDNGMVAKSDVDRILGKRGATLFAQIEAMLDGGKRTVPTQRRRTKYKWLPKVVLDKIARSADNRDLIERMPVLGQVTRMIGGKDKLAGMKMVCVQHMFPTTEGLFDALKDNGLDPHQAEIYGKNYSTNEDTLYRMRAKGWNVPELSITALVTVDPATGRPRQLGVGGDHLAELFDGVDPNQKSEPKFLILDEGGKILKALHEDYPEYAHLCVAVEQTDHGIQVIEELQRKGIELKCPVVSVARSWAKKDYESPMIGESVVHGTETALADLHPDLKIQPKEAAVIGYGAVGKATADALRRRGYKVFVHDIDPEKMKQAKADGCVPGPRDNTLAHGHLLFSATGRTTIRPEEFEGLLPDKAVLVNAASGNHELGMDAHEVGGGFFTEDAKERVDEEGYRRTEFNGLDVRLGDLAGNEQMFSRVLRTDSGQERLVLRSGYVVNMVDDIPPEYIQLTRSLLLAGCLQAAKFHGRPGMHDIDEPVQQLVVTRTKKHLAKSRLTLERPDFRKLAPAEN